MAMTELEKLFRDAGITICPICGTPYEPYHSRQKTCGSDKCKREWKNAYMRERTRKQREEDLDGWRKYHRNAQRKYRAKQKGIEEFANELADLRKYAKHQEDFEKFIAEHGHEYGKYSAEKVLATVPKIDTNLEKK